MKLLQNDDVGPSRLVVNMRYGRRGRRRCRPHRGVEIGNLVDQFDEEGGVSDYDTNIKDFIDVEEDEPD